jgi:hypothetical protein
MYTKRGIELPREEAPPPAAQAAAPPSGKEEGHVPLTIKIRRAGSESIMEPTRTEGPKILLRLPKVGGMAAPSSTQGNASYWEDEGTAIAFVGLVEPIGNALLKPPFQEEHRKGSLSYLSRVAPAAIALQGESPVKAKSMDAGVAAMAVSSACQGEH